MTLVNPDYASLLPTTDGEDVDALVSNRPHIKLLENDNGLDTRVAAIEAGGGSGLFTDLDVTNQLTVGVGGIISNTDVNTVADLAMMGRGLLTSQSDMIFQIDSDHDQTTAAYLWKHDGSTVSAGTVLMSLAENGILLIPVGGDLQVGTMTFTNMDNRLTTLEGYLPANVTDALGAASGPALSNPFATLGDLGGISSPWAAAVQTVQNLRDVAPGDRLDKQCRLLEDNGAVYRFDSIGTGVDNADTIITPTSGTGRWFKASSATPDLSSVLTTGNSAGSKKITNLLDPTSAQDAATRAYVLAQDAVLSGLISANTGDITTLDGRVDNLEEAVGNLGTGGFAAVWGLLCENNVVNTQPSDFAGYGSKWRETHYGGAFHHQFDHVGVSGAYASLLVGIEFDTTAAFTANITIERFRLGGTIYVYCDGILSHTVSDGSSLGYPTTCVDGTGGTHTGPTGYYMTLHFTFAVAGPHRVEIVFHEGSSQHALLSIANEWLNNANVDKNSIKPYFAI